MENNEQAMKEKAIELLKKMDIYKPYIKGFEEKDSVCFFENYGGYWIDQEGTRTVCKDERDRKQIPMPRICRNA